MVTHFAVVELDNAIRFNTLPMALGSCGINPDGPTILFVSFNTRQGLKCSHVASTPTLT